MLSESLYFWFVYAIELPNSLSIWHYCKVRPNSARGENGAFKSVDEHHYATSRSYIHLKLALTK